MWAGLGRLLEFILRPYMRHVENGSERARVLMFDANDPDRIVMTRDWISNQKWGLPGGGIGKLECTYCAAQREVKEELGLDIERKRFVHVAEFEVTNEENITHKAVLFSVTIDENEVFVAKKPEVLEAKWQQLSDLPSDISILAKTSIQQYEQKQTA